MKSKDLLAGALAGLSGVLALMVALALLLGIGMIWQFAFYTSIPVLNTFLLPAMFQDINRFPQFLWGWRWIWLAMIVGGVPLAWVERFAQRYPPPWRDRIAPALLLAIITTALIAQYLIQSDQFLYAGAGQMEYDNLRVLQAAQPSIWSMLLVGLALSVGMGGAAWIYWSWWYTHLRRWMGLPKSASSEHESESPDVAFARRQARERYRLITLGLTAASLLLVAGAIRGYESVRTRARSGDLWVQSSTPASELPFSLERPVRLLVVENTYGSGAATVRVLAARDRTTVTEAQELVFEPGRLGKARVILNMDGLPNGEYLLNAELRAGAEVRMSYALVQGYGALVSTTALLVGLGMGVVVAALTLLLSMLPQQQSRE